MTVNQHLQHDLLLQHIAFETDDLIATLKNLPIVTLPIPENYYDDLEARFGLEPDFVTQLKQLNMPYDETEEGFFLQPKFYQPLFL